MSVTIDDQTLEVDRLGIKTVGQVLSHVARENRLVVNVLIDGESPDLDQMGVVRAVGLAGKTVYVETADPREMAGDVLAEVAEHLGEADGLRGEAVEALSVGQQSQAMQKLSACFSVWQHAQESVIKTAQLLRLDLEHVVCDGRPLAELVGEFAGQLRQIKTALEGRDFVTLGDILQYEMTETSARWMSAVNALRESILAAH